MSRLFAAVLCLAVLASLAADAKEWLWDLPKDVPLPRIPADNPMSVEKVELGRRLFFDRRLSGNATISCASCHLQKLAFTDGQALSLGSTGKRTHRNSPALFNLAWLPTYTWANPSLATLERQASMPMFGDDPPEMGINDANRQEVLDRLAADADYPRAFALVFPETGQAIGFDQIIKAIAAFERSILSFGSKYDRFKAGKARLSASEARGMALFFGPVGACSSCHGGFNFSGPIAAAGDVEVNVSFHETGLATSHFPNRGLYEFTGKDEDIGRFRAPSLRNVALTGPYMHDGRFDSLAQAIQGHLKKPLAAAQLSDLTVFLETLNDPELLSSTAYSPDKTDN